MFSDDIITTGTSLNAEDSCTYQLSIIMSIIITVFKFFSDC